MIESSSSTDQTMGFASTLALRASEVIFKRLYLLIIFNLILEICIAIISIFSLLIRLYKLFSSSLMLLMVIWLVEQYRITDYYHQFGQMDMINSKMIISTHTFHFVAILLGLLILLTKQTNTKNNCNGSAKRHSLPNNRVSVADFANLDSNNNPIGDNHFNLSSNFNTNWMRSTFTKSRSDRSNAAQTPLTPQATQMEVLKEVHVQP